MVPYVLTAREVEELVERGRRETASGVVLHSGWTVEALAEELERLRARVAHLEGR